jgi:hypothetical protein
MQIHISEWSPKKLAIIEATLIVIALEGFDHTTTAKIAKQAGAGEGTIYRHFKNKNELISTTALYSSHLIFGPARLNFLPNTSVQAQFIQFCHDFLETGMKMPLHHQFMEQYINSPPGIEYRKKVLSLVMHDPALKPLVYPLNRILIQGKQQQILKDIPIQLLIALSMGPMAFIVKHSAQGFLQLDEALISHIAEGCWDAIRR